MSLVGALLISSGAALLVERVPRPKSLTIGSRISGRRRKSLLDAVGSANGSETTLRSIARTQVLAALVVGVLALFFVVSKPTPVNVLASVFLVGAAWQCPLIIARSRESKRRATMDLELSDALGEMVMGVEAGLTLEAVMNLYARRHRTNLAREFEHVLDRIGLGVPRVEALSEMGERTSTPGVRMFVAAVQQNQKLGTPLAGALRQQGETARRRRRQAVEEHAAKLSLKMIFPTVFCVLPVLLIVIVGPAMVRLIDALP